MIGAARTQIHMAVFHFQEISPRALITFTKATSPDLRVHVGTQVFVPGIETQTYETPHPADPKQPGSLEIAAFVGAKGDDQAAEVRALLHTDTEGLFAVYSADNASRQPHPDLVIPDAYLLIVPSQ
jgi:hypothetical protein